MTNQDYTHIAVVLDRSGSMASCKHDMEGGLNAFFQEQAKEPGKCLVDFVQFDTQYEEVYRDREIAKAKAVLQPRGATALLDALGKTVTAFGEKLAAQDESERPGTVLVVVVTDGYENSSREWTREAVKALVERQQDDYNWNFVFLGANMDAVAEGARFGFAAGSSMTYDTTHSGITTQALSGYTTRLRGTGSAEFTEDERSKSVGG